MQNISLDPATTLPLNNLLAKVSASRVTLTINDVKYRTNKNEVSLLHEPVPVAKGQLITTIHKFYKIFHWSVEIQVNQDASDENWLNIISGEVFIIFSFFNDNLKPVWAVAIPNVVTVCHLFQFNAVSH